jgi:hypothetical protein
MPLRRISGLLLALLLATVTPTNKLNAQTTTSGGLTGVVTDPSQAVVPDAAVEIMDNAKGTTQSTKTDREGVYQFSFLAPGRYTLTVTHAGFREEKRAMNILLGPTVSANVTLQVANVSTRVSVIAEAPLLQAENGDRLPVAAGIGPTSTTGLLRIAGGWRLRGSTEGARFWSSTTSERR